MDMQVGGVGVTSPNSSGVSSNANQNSQWHLDTSVNDFATIKLIKEVEGHARKEITFTKDRPFVITIIGPPRAGKTTQADLLQQAFGILRIYQRGLIGEELEHKESLYSKMVDVYTTKNVLPTTPDIVSSGLLVQHFRQNKGYAGFTMVGWPLTKEQDEDYQEVFLRNAFHIPIFLNVSEEVIKEREADANFHTQLKEFKASLKEFVVPNNESEEMVYRIGNKKVHVIDLNNEAEEEVFHKLKEHINVELDLLEQQEAPIKNLQAKLTNGFVEHKDESHNDQSKEEKTNGFSTLAKVTILAALVAAFGAGYFFKSKSN